MCTAEFTMLPQGDATHLTTNVTWLMHGLAPFMSKVMQVFMNMFEASTTEGASDAGQSLSVLQRQLRSGVQVL